MESLHNFQHRQRKKILLSTPRKMKVLSTLNSDCRNKISENDQNISDHGKEVIAFLQKEQQHVECLRELKKYLTNPVLEGSIQSISDVIGLVDEMLSIHTNLYSTLICGKGDLSDALKQLSSCLDIYVSYSVLFSLEKTNFQKISEVHDDFYMDIDLLQEPITHISRYKDLFQNLYSTVPEEIYASMIKTVEIILNSMQSKLSVWENAVRILQIQRFLLERKPKILSPGRIVLKEGILYKVNNKASRLKERVFFLFNDIFLCCKILSKTFNWQEKDSLLFCALFPLSMCSASLVMGSLDQGTLFKVTCGKISYLLISEIPGEAYIWFHELQNAIRMCKKPNEELKPKLNRRKNISLKQRIPPFLKQHTKSEEDFNIKKITDDQTASGQCHSKTTTRSRIMKFLACVMHEKET